MITISALNVYPVKSCRGTSLTTATLDARGIEWDRRWMIVDPRGSFFTQRELPPLALVEPTINGSVLRLAAPGRTPLEIPLRADGPRCDVIVWDDECIGVDQGEDVGRWLSDYLQTECRLVRMADECVRPVDPQYAPRATDQTGFSDGFPMLLISEASLEDLNARLERPVPMDRFRPNIVIRGCDPFAEDSWQRIRIGDLTLSVVKPCARCKMTTIDQQTAESGKEPLRTLSTYRTIQGRGVMFGQNIVHDAPGTMSVGDRVEVMP